MLSITSIKKLFTTNVIVALVVCSIFIIPRIYKQFNTQNTVDNISRIEITLNLDKTIDVEKFGKDIFATIGSKELSKYKNEFYEALLFIGFAAMREQGSGNKYITVSDFYVKGIEVLYKIAKENDNKIKIIAILQAAEQLKLKRPNYWKDFVDDKDDKERQKAIAAKQATDKEAVDRLEGYSDTVDVLLGKK